MNLRFDLLFIMVLSLHDDKKFLQESWDAFQNVDISDGMKCLDPLDENHLAVLVL